MGGRGVGSWPSQGGLATEEDSPKETRETRGQGTRALRAQHSTWSLTWGGVSHRTLTFLPGLCAAVPTAHTRGPRAQNEGSAWIHKRETPEGDSPSSEPAGDRAEQPARLSAALRRWLRAHRGLQ